MTTIKETRREHGLRACGRSGRGLGPFLPRPAQTCHGPSAGRIPPPCSAGCASPLPSSLPPSRPAVPGCDHRGPTLTAVFLRPPLLMGRRDERSQARAKPSRWPSGSRGFFFFLSFFRAREACGRRSNGAMRAGSTSDGSCPGCRDAGVSCPPSPAGREGATEAAAS